MTTTLANRFANSKLVVYWLNDNKKELVEKCANKSFSECSEQANKQKVHLKLIVDDYIDWLLFSLNTGIPINLNEVSIKLLPLTKKYIIAFQALMEEVNLSQMSEECKHEVQPYIRFLISWLETLKVIDETNEIVLPL